MNLRVNLADMANESRHVGEPYGEVEVKLSRRNLLSLLHKLDRDGEATRTLSRMDEMIHLVIVAEEDEDHYGDRRPGDMGDDIEEKIASGDHPWPEDD